MRILISLEILINVYGIFQLMNAENILYWCIVCSVYIVFVLLT